MKNKAEKCVRDMRINIVIICINSISPYESDGESSRENCFPLLFQVEKRMEMETKKRNPGILDSELQLYSQRMLNRNALIFIS